MPREVAITTPWLRIEGRGTEPMPVCSIGDMTSRESKMPTYTFFPEEHDFEPEELVADGPQQMLGAIYGCGWNKARVLQDGAYIFTVSRSVDGVWSILPGLPGADGGS
jgi:hypothetical protein